MGLLFIFVAKIRAESQMGVLGGKDDSEKTLKMKWSSRHT